VRRLSRKAGKIWNCAFVAKGQEYGPFGPLPGRYVREHRLQPGDEPLDPADDDIVSERVLHMTTTIAHRFTSLRLDGALHRSNYG
jgi:hypothetical protein